MKDSVNELWGISLRAVNFFRRNGGAVSSGACRFVFCYLSLPTHVIRNSLHYEESRFTEFWGAKAEKQLLVYPPGFIQLRAEGDDAVQLTIFVVLCKAVGWSNGQGGRSGWRRRKDWGCYFEIVEKICRCVGFLDSSSPVGGLLVKMGTQCVLA